MRFTAFESLLNRNIKESAAARALCQRLAGKSIALQLTGVPTSIFLRSHGDHVALSSKSEATPDATLSGTLLGMLSLAGTQPESAVRGGSVHIEGDAEVAQAFRALLKEARPDLEEELARLIGDVPAHQLGKLAGSALNFGQRAMNTFLQNVGEYLQEESRDVPSRTELNEFIHAVDQLRDAAERAEARLAILEQRARRPLT